MSSKGNKGTPQCAVFLSRAPRSASTAIGRQNFKNDMRKRDEKKRDTSSQRVLRSLNRMRSINSKNRATQCSIWWRPPSSSRHLHEEMGRSALSATAATETGLKARRQTGSASVASPVPPRAWTREQGGRDALTCRNRILLAIGDRPMLLLRKNAPEKHLRVLGPLPLAG